MIRVLSLEASLLHLFENDSRQQNWGKISLDSSVVDSCSCIIEFEFRGFCIFNFVKSKNVSGDKIINSSHEQEWGKVIKIMKGLIDLTHLSNQSELDIKF